MYVRERFWSDMDMYGDVKSLEEGRQLAATFLADDRVHHVSIRESHQPDPGLPWVVGPFIEEIDRQ